MILFKKEHVQPILNDRKTQTRRTGKLRWKVGAIRQAKTGYNKDSEFAKLHIKSIRQEPLGLITEADALAEGYNSITEYKEVFERIYGFWNDDLIVHVIDFERVKEFSFSVCGSKDMSSETLEALGKAAEIAYQTFAKASE